MPAGTLSVQLTGCTISAVRADMLKSRVKITFETHLDDEMLEAKRLLAILAVDESPVDLTIVEQQMRLPFTSRAEAEGRA